MKKLLLVMGAVLLFSAAISLTLFLFSFLMSVLVMAVKIGLACALVYVGYKMIKKVTAKA